MKLLLDTAPFLWAITGSSNLSDQVSRALADTATQVFLSVASVWEMSIKFGLGKLPLPDDPDRYIPAQRKAAGIQLLEISEEAAGSAHRLPTLHRDPFDRILISQAIGGGMVLATNDAAIRRYPVQTLW